MKSLRPGRTLLQLVAILGVFLVGLVILGWRGALPPIDAPTVGSFEVATVRKGAQLAAIGNCVTCHTSAGGAAFSGGRALVTPFGTIYSTNITPDPDTGIGRWSEAAFQRAMRQGVDREGNHLYPAFPYDHFTLVSDADDAALYAYFMTRQPVQSHAPDNALVFPLDVRLVLEGWKLFFLREGPYVRDPKHDERWNRGAYLVNGLGHCGACHTPRNQFGAELAQKRFGGAAADGWRAYAINSESPAPIAWDADALYQYLRTSWVGKHPHAHGPMAAVISNLTRATPPVPDLDIRAMAQYLAWMMATSRPGTHRVPGATAGPTPAAPAAATAAPVPIPLGTAEANSGATGPAIYASACASCHDGLRPPPFGGVKLGFSTAVRDDDATNLINVVLDGLHPPAGTAGAIMPGFATTLTDGQLESLLAYLRSDFGARPPWNNVEAGVRASRNRDHD